MVIVSSLVFPLLERVREIDAALADCADDAKRKDLLAEREVKHTLLSDLLDAAVTTKRRRK